MKKLTIIILSVTLLTGCTISSNSMLVNNPTKEELAQAKTELNDARQEINQREDITSFEKNIANFALDIADEVGISIAENIIKGDD